MDEGGNFLRVLLADDEPAIRVLVKTFLDGRFDIVEAANGREALDLVPDATTLDLLITDVVMPEMQGHELSRRMRQQNPDLRVLYLTGYVDHLFEMKDRMWAFEAYLDKPFTEKSLNEAVAMLVSGRSSLEA
jgi:two-component system, cell cycle sensor histidine kinase and response regulator CckA